MNEVRFYLDITPDQYRRYYSGSVRDVVVTAFDGRRVRFPAAALRSHITHSGIRGEFVLRFDRQNKLVGLERVG